MKNLSRRSFQKTVATASTAIPMFSIGKAGQSANNKVNIAMIGAGGIAGQAYGGSLGENIVALCDTDSKAMAKAKKVDKFQVPSAATEFQDFRVMLDKLGDKIDMVCVNTPDHTHFAATMAAMERGIHVFTQKPLVHDIWQARTLKKAQDKYKVHTNMGNQGHTCDGIRQLKEWYDHGIFGQITEVHSFIHGPDWNSRYFKRPESLLPEKKPIPDHLDWDLWLGPVEHTEYNPIYHPRLWRGFNRFGTGTFGDWFCHVADAPVWLLDLYEPVSVEAVKVAGGNEHLVVDGCSVRFDFERRGDKAPCSFYWHNGMTDEFKPKAPADWSWPGRPKHKGTYYHGTKNNGYTDERSNNPRLASKEAAIAFKKSGYPAETIRRVKGGPIRELVQTIKGEIPECGSNFNYAAPFTEVMLLGLIAANHGGKIEWDSKKPRITNRPELNKYLKDPVRKGWEYGRALWK